MAGLDNNIDFSALSDEELLKLLDEEREKRKQFAPARAKANIKSQTSPKSPRTPRAPKGEIVEIDLD